MYDLYRHLRLIILTNAIKDACALVRLQADHVNRNLVPAFYRYLQAQDPAAQVEGGKEFHAALEGLANLLERTEKECTDDDFKSVGLWNEKGELGWTDVMAGPCKLFRRIWQRSIDTVLTLKL